MNTVILIADSSDRSGSLSPGTTSADAGPACRRVLYRMELKISFILLTVVGGGWKDQIFFYTIWGLNLIVFSAKVFLVLFCSRRTAYIVRDNAKKFTSVGISYMGLILFSKNILRVRCSLRKIKEHFLRIFWSEHCGNAVKRAKWSLWLRNLKVVALTVQRRARCLSMLPFVRNYKLK